MRVTRLALGIHLFASFMVLGGYAVPARAQRSVHGTVLTSAVPPPVALRLDFVLTHAGSREFTLGAADAEQYVFVEAERARIRRLSWFQLEGSRDTSRRFDYSADSTNRSARGAC